jgi:hypothetical protein
MIGHGLGPGGRDWFLEEGEETHLRMKSVFGIAVAVVVVV